MKLSKFERIWRLIAIISSLSLETITAIEDLVRDSKTTPSSIVKKLNAD